MVARGRAEEMDARLTTHGTGPNKRQRLYEEHLGSADIMAGIQAGTYHQGSIRTSRYNPWEAFVSSASVGQDIVIKGRTAMNRAIDGDVVVVALLPVEEWEGEGGMLVKEGEEGGEEEGGAGIAEVCVWGVGEVSVCVTF